MVFLKLKFKKCKLFAKKKLFCNYNASFTRITTCMNIPSTSLTGMECMKNYLTSTGIYSGTWKKKSTHLGKFTIHLCI